MKSRIGYVKVIYLLLIFMLNCIGKFMVEWGNVLKYVEIMEKVLKEELEVCIYCVIIMIVISGNKICIFIVGVIMVKIEDFLGKYYFRYMFRYLLYY